MTNDQYIFQFEGGADDSAPNVHTMLSQGLPLQVPLTHMLYLKAPAAFNVANGVATASHRAIEGLLTRRSPWAADVKALQLHSWATRLTFLEDLLKAYDEHVNLKADGAYTSLDELAEAFGKASHLIGHDALLISMDRIHSIPHPQLNGVQPDELRYINMLTGDMLAGAVGDIGVAAVFRCASCFAFGAYTYDPTHQQETFFNSAQDGNKGRPIDRRWLAGRSGAGGRGSMAGIHASAVVAADLCGRGEGNGRSCSPRIRPESRAG